MSEDQTQHAGTCYDPSTSEVEVGGPGVQGQPWLHRQFEASLGYVRVCFKRAKTKVKNHQIQYMLLTKRSDMEIKENHSSCRTEFKSKDSQMLGKCATTEL